MTIDKVTDKALTRVNNMLCDGNRMGLFVTAWFGILDLETGYMEFANAGHPYPLFYKEPRIWYTTLCLSRLFLFNSKQREGYK